MNGASQSKIRLVIAALALCTLAVAGSAQVKFVQITDPHIFDDETSEDRQNNLTALVAAVEKINERMGEGANYDFVVITGDLGVEALIAKRSRRAVDEEATANNLRKKASELAEILKQSRVRRWIFVAGNNDLDGEKPATIKYYNSFVEVLETALKDKEIIDLNRDGRVNVYTTNGLSFIGFNDASFKNQNESSRLKCVPEDNELANEERKFPIHSIQLKEVQAVHVTLKKSDIVRAYVLYHIPEVDDPHLIKLGPNDEDLKAKLSSKHCIGEQNIYSPWFVRRQIRDEWNEVVRDEKVKGLFAGHFHDSWRETYLNSHWMRSSEYPSGSLSKLYVCPPLAVKFQRDAKEQARGFQEVSIDAQGNVLDAAGRSGVHIFWYDQATRTFNTDFDDEKEVAALEQIKFGQLFENNGRMKDAEAAYTKALATDYRVTHQRASEGLNRVVAKQSSPWNKYLFTQWPLSPEGSVFLTALVIFFLLSTVFSADIISFARRGRSVSAMATTILVVILTLVVWAGMWLGDRFFLAEWKASLSSNVSILLTGLVVAASLLLLLQIMRIRGRDKLLVVPLVDITEHGLGGTFPQVFSMVREDMLWVRNFGMIAPTWGPPIIVIGGDAEIVELIESTIGGVRGKIIGWLFRKTTRPEYILRGTLQTAGANLTITARLERKGRVLQTWRMTFATADLFTQEQQLAQDILNFLET